MHIHLVAIGRRMPAWVDQGYREYARRLPRECALDLIELPLAARAKARDPARAVVREGAQMLAAAPHGARLVALDEHGVPWSTCTVAERLGDWMAQGRDVALLLGGPDGLAPACLERAEVRWSLSPLTLPHGLARVIVAEQIYRAWSLLRHHPYHRA